MKKLRVFILAVVVLMLLSSFGCLAFTYSDLYMRMDIPDGFEQIEWEEDYSSDVYINASAGQQIAVKSVFNFDDISYSGLSDAEIRKIKNDADYIFIPEGSNNYFLSEPVASRIYADSVDGGLTDGVRIRASYFDTSSNMEVYSTVYLFSVESYYYAISFVSYDNSEYWYKECLDSLLIGDYYGAKYGSTSSSLTDNYSSTYSQKTSSVSRSDFSLADFFEGLGTLLGIAFIIFLIYRLLFKKK